MTEFGRNLWLSSGPTPLKVAQAGLARTCPDSFRRSLRRENPQSKPRHLVESWQCGVSGGILPCLALMDLVSMFLLPTMLHWLQSGSTWSKELAPPCGRCRINSPAGVTERAVHSSQTLHGKQEEEGRL